MTLRQFLVLLSVMCSAPWSMAEDPSASETLETWLLTLPPDFQEKVLWYADHEEGTLHDWEYDGPRMSGGGVFNTGSTAEAFAKVVSHISYSGTYSVQTVIKNAFRCQNGNKAVRLMRWTDKPWDQGGKEFPQEAFYSTWMMIPENYSPNKEPPWDPGDGGWWNIFQFKSDDKLGESHPLWVLNIMRDKRTQEMKLYLYSKYNRPRSHDVAAVTLPVGKWFHLEAFYKQSGRMAKDGEIALWFEGHEVFRAQNVLTRLDGAAVIWGIGNYTDHIDGGAVPGTATVYFDDALVSTAAVHPHVKARRDATPGTQDAIPTISPEKWISGLGPAPAPEN